MATKTFKDATRSLQEHFSAARVPQTLPSESRRILQSFVDEYDEDAIDGEESLRADHELRKFWEKHVGREPSKLGAFAGVLRELRPVISEGGDVLEWWSLAIKPIITGTTFQKTALDDAQEFLVGCMAFNESEDAEEEAYRKQTKASESLMKELLDIYITRTRTISDEDEFQVPENAQVALQVENVLIAFGRKQPKSLFHGLDDLIAASSTRLQALSLLNCFVRHPTPHLYLVINTPLVEHLLKCLMNDTSLSALSAALTSLLMLLPHIPGSLSPHLPRLFLVYSRLLCWEKFSPLSTEAQRSLVTDDRVDLNEEKEHGDVGIDQSWDKLRPRDGMVEASTPELMTLFTYLYGMYPLNFMAYVRKSRRYLRNAEFPRANDFDLDQAVIRSRTEQFRQVHLLHPNFFNLTIEEELNDSKWAKTDPADVVADCHGLCVNAGSSLAPPGPPPTGRLPDVPSTTTSASAKSGKDSPVRRALGSVASFEDSPVLKGLRLDDDSQAEGSRPQSKSSAVSHFEASQEDFAYSSAPLSGSTIKEKSNPPPQTNLAYLQRENTLLRNELNFEKWHKGQYSQHIGQIMRKNVKDATAEAETLNLINANRALKQQLEQVRKARETTIKDSTLTRKQANSLETNMGERLAKMKKEQEVWLNEASELQRLREEAKEFRGILVAAESRETNTGYELQIMKREIEQMQSLQNKLEDARKKIREYEYRDFEFDRSKREMEILQNEKEVLQRRVRAHEEDRDRTHRMYMDRFAELESHHDPTDPFQRSRMGSQSPPDMTAAADSQMKLTQLKKSHARLLEKYTDLELEYQTTKSQLETLQQRHRTYGSGALPLDHVDEHYDHLAQARTISPTTSAGRGGWQDRPYDISSEHTLSALDASNISTSDPTNRRYQLPIRTGLVSPPNSDIALAGPANMTWNPPSALSRNESLASRSSNNPKSPSAVTAAFNPSAPLNEDEMARSVMSFESGESSASKKADKIQPDSQVRVYGRGGAQNIKMKSKEKEKVKGEKAKSSPLKGLRGFM